MGDTQPRAAGERARTGIDGLDDILGGGLPQEPPLPDRGQSRLRQDHRRPAVPSRGRLRGRVRPLRHPLGDADGADRAWPRSHGWSLDGIRLYELAAGEEGSEERLHPLPPLRGGAQQDDAGRARRGGGDQADAGRVRLALGDAAAGAGRAALPPPDPGPEAVLHRPRAARSSCSTTAPRTRPTCSSRASPTASSTSSSSRPSTARSGGGCGSRSCAASPTAAGTTTSRSPPAASSSSPASSPPTTKDSFAPGDAPSGIAELDALLGGGLDRGSSTLIVGPAGPGKTSLALDLRPGGHEARARRRSSTPSRRAWARCHARARGLGWDLEGALASGRLVIQLVNPAELSPGEFADGVRRTVDEKKASRSWSSTA